MTTRRSASLAVHGEVKPGHINAAPKAPLHCGGEAPAPGPELFTLHSGASPTGVVLRRPASRGFSAATDTAGCLVRRIHGLLGVAALLTGCSLLPAPESLTIYTLPASSTTAVSATAGVRPSVQADTRLYVAEPLGNRLLSSNRILVQPARSELGVYQGVRWTDPNTAVFRDRLLQAFRGDAHYVSASADETLLADLALGGDLLAFQAEQDGQAPPHVHVRYDAILWRFTDRSVVAARSFERRVQAGDRSVGAVVKALGLASDDVVAQVVAWTTSQRKAALDSAGP